MANRPRGYGLTAEVKGKMAAKYEIEKEQEARVWMEALVGEPLDADASPSQPLGPDAFYAALKDGKFLCKVAERVTGKKVKFNNMKMAFKQMENISNFLSACEAYGVSKTDLFQTVDLYENQNLWQVVCCIHALGRRAQANGFDGPVLGPKESLGNKREFTEEQLNAGQNVIGLQMGSNEGATQSGLNFGKSRGIMGTDK